MAKVVITHVIKKWSQYNTALARTGGNVLLNKNFIKTWTLLDLNSLQKRQNEAIENSATFYLKVNHLIIFCTYLLGLEEHKIQEIITFSISVLNVF